MRALALPAEKRFPIRMPKKRLTRAKRRIPNPNERQFVRCRICSRYYRAITWTHLRSKHGMKLGEYRQEFGLRYLHSDGLRSLVSAIHIRWTRKLVIEQLQQRRRRGKSLAYMKVERESGNLARAAIRLFGSYETAVRAAGYDYRKLYPLPAQRKWTDDRILKKIRKYHREKRRLNAGSVVKYDAALCSAARNYMGSWAAAVERAGISYERIRVRQQWTKATILQALRHHYRRKNLGRLPDKLRSAAGLHFGSVDNARRAAGIKWARMHWTREVVIERFQQRRRRGKSLAYMKVRRDDAKLARASIRLFGSYETAVRAAGYDYRKLYPPQYRRKWTGDRILKKIRQYHREKRPLNAGLIIKYGAGLYQAAQNHMGSWAAAVERAGISYETIRRRRPHWTKPEILQALRHHYRRKERGRLPSNLNAAAVYRFGSMAEARRAAGLNSSQNKDDVRTPTSLGTRQSRSQPS